MIGSLSNKLIVGFAIVAALFWTLALGLIYGLMAATDTAWRWLDSLISFSPELSQWLSASGAWLGQFGSGLLLVVWAFGMAVVVLLALFARRLVNLIPKLQRAVGMS